MPLSVLALGAVLEGREDYTIVDGNVDRAALGTLRSIIARQGRDILLAVSVMPGTQMANAIAHSRSLKREFPHLTILWGGYLPSMHTDAVINTPYIDFVLRGQAEETLPQLLQARTSGTGFEEIRNLSYKADGKIVHNGSNGIFDPNARPLFPYERLRMEEYAIQTFVGNRTYCHETSVGCPHKCNFCGVVDVFNSRWKAETPERTLEVVRVLKKRFGMDGIEFHDSDFFVSEKRVALLAEKLIGLDLQWWGEGRVDTLLTYEKEAWHLMKRSGLRMIFLGAESGLDETLRLMDKGGVTIEKTKEIAARCREYGIQPEFSFVMGAHPTRTREDIDATINLMYELEKINPASRMHPFIYTPVPFGAIYDAAAAGGLRYPRDLDEWESPEWKQYTLRRDPHTRWLTRRLSRRIMNFRAVQQSYHVRTNDLRLARWKLVLLRVLGGWRYKLRFFAGAYELRLMLRILLRRSADMGRL